MRRLLGLLLIAGGGSQFLISVGLIDASLNDLWPLGVLTIGLWLLAGAIRRPRQGGLTIGILAASLGVYQLGQTVFDWRTDLLLPVMLLSVGLGLLLRSTIRAEAA